MASSEGEKNRQGRLEKARKDMLDEFERQKAAIARESARDRTSSSRFTKQGDSMEETLKLQTIGLRHLNDFQEVRKELEELKAREAAKTSELQEEEGKKRKKLKKKAALSFAVDNEGEEEQVDDRPVKKSKFGKDPKVNTTFLPDREREEAERREREELRQEWIRKQEEMKQETINVVFSFWDGSGHRKDVDVKKGDTIASFLEKTRPLFPELRGVNVDNLMYIKEDLIIPHHYTFYDFILNKARGKSGPLFNFDVHDDVRLLADATIEKDESHAGKVVERAWYERNKHIFPANRWEIYDPDKDYGSVG